MDENLPPGVSQNSGPAQPLPLEQADVRYFAGFFGFAEAFALQTTLRGALSWEQHRVTIGGRQVPCPRLSSWHGDPTATYTYSGLTLSPKPWSPTLTRIRDRLEQATGHRFNSVLANLYRDGNDAMGWHADQEPELGAEPVIASLSFGAERTFVLRHRRAKGRASVKLGLAHGSLLLMAGPTQHFWRHSLPRTKRPVDERINLTYRLVR